MIIMALNKLFFPILKKISYYPLPSGLFRDNLQHCLGDFARLLKVQFTSSEGMSNDAPIHECESEIGLPLQIIIVVI